MWPCLLSSHRTRVTLTGVEGFPHGGFRHFIRNINLRGVTPEEQGEEEGMIREKVGDRMSRDLGEVLARNIHRMHLKTDLDTENKTNMHILRQESETFPS